MIISNEINNNDDNVIIDIIDHKLNDEQNQSSIQVAKNIYNKSDNNNNNNKNNNQQQNNNHNQSLSKITQSSSSSSLIFKSSFIHQSINHSFSKFKQNLKMMGCLSCINKNNKLKNDQQIENSNDIDKTIKKWKNNESKVIKMLLLGPGESGKTTIIKQMKILHIEGFTSEERIEKLQEIKENIFESIKELASNMEYLNPPIQLVNEENQNSFNFIKNLDITKMKTYDYSDEFFEHTKCLWSDPGTQACYRRANEFSLLDSAKYFLDKIDEIRDPNYIPNDQDILHSRKRTSELQEIKFVVKKQPFCMFDVGGQKGERRKWFQVFDGIKTILFVVDSSGFDMKLREDGNINRLEESINLFREVWTSNYLLESGIILFLNKQDILKEKIKNGHRIEDYFSGYKDYVLTTTTKKQKDKNETTTTINNNNQDDQYEYEYTKAKNFIRDKFEQVTKEYKIQRSFYSHFTTATDTKNIKLVFDDVHEMCLKENFNYIVS